MTLPALRTCTLAAIGFLGLAALSPAQAVDRTTYVVNELDAHNAGLTPALRAEKYGLMEQDLFSFYRGSNDLYWLDFGTSAQLSTYGSAAATRIWLGGDMHADNMGAFTNDQGTVVYDLNDFDEAVLGDYQLDLWRAAVSLVLMMRDNGGFSATDESNVVDSFTESYLDTIEARRGNSSEKTATYVHSNTYGQLDDLLADAAGKTRKQMLDKWTSKNGSGVRFLDPSINGDLGTADAATVSAITAQMAAYGATLSGGVTYSSSKFHVKSVAQRLHAGIGSLGTTRYYVLIEGATSGQDDDLILDVKAQAAPTAYLNLSAASVAATNTASANNPAKRVVTAAKGLGNYADDYLGWMTVSGQLYSVRELSPTKDTLDTTTLDSIDRMTKMAEQWGAILATAHCRADQDANATNVPYDFDQQVYNRINGNHPAFRAQVRGIVLPYADQVEDDFASFWDVLAP